MFLNVQSENLKEDYISVLNKLGKKHFSGSVTTCHTSSKKKSDLSGSFSIVLFRNCRLLRKMSIAIEGIHLRRKSFMNSKNYFYMYSFLLNLLRVPIPAAKTSQKMAAYSTTLFCFSV